jgi:hypothetical protein
MTLTTQIPMTLAPLPTQIPYTQNLKEGGELRVAYPSETKLEDTLVEDYLVKKWAFQNTLLLIKEMIRKLGMLDKGIPTPKEAINWSVPDDLMFCWAKTKVEFDIGHNVEVMCGAFFCFHLQEAFKAVQRLI